MCSQVVMDVAKLGDKPLSDSVMRCGVGWHRGNSQFIWPLSHKAQSAGSQLLRIHWSSLIQPLTGGFPVLAAVGLSKSKGPSRRPCWVVAGMLFSGQGRKVRAEIIPFRCVCYIQHGSGSIHSCPPFLGGLRVCGINDNIAVKLSLQSNTESVFLKDLYLRWSRSSWTSFRFSFPHCSDDCSADFTVH